MIKILKNLFKDLLWIIILAIPIKWDTDLTYIKSISIAVFLVGSGEIIIEMICFYSNLKGLGYDLKRISKLQFISVILPNIIYWPLFYLTRDDFLLFLVGILIPFILIIYVIVDIVSSYVKRM